MTMLDEALRYRQMNLSVIPVAKDKKPLIPWKEYQDRLATEDEITNWWTNQPDANIGIVTGKISGITVLDCDSQEAINAFREHYKGLTPAVKTPRGMHFYYRYEEGIRNTVRVGNLDMDIRGEGGYVVAPPSVNDKGQIYKWHISLSLNALDSFSSLKSFSLYREVVDMENSGRPQMSTMSTNVHKYFYQGRRDEDLFHVANAMVKGGAQPGIIRQALEMLAYSCTPPFPEREIEAKIQSAIERSKRRERNVAQEVEDFVMSTSGRFLSTDIHKATQMSTRHEMKATNEALRRLIERKVIERVGDRNGCYRRIENDPIEFMDFVNVSADGIYDLKLPLDIHEKTMIFPKAVIVLAGVTGFGKTTWMLNIIRDNMHKYNFYYFNSEISPLGLNKKLGYFHYPIHEWKMKVIPDDKWDHTNIADKVYPDDVNIIDYLEPEGEKSYNVHHIITNITKRLNKGIAIIATQKKPDVDLSSGGVYSAKASSLYLSLDWGRIKIFKNRYREEDPHPLFILRDFEIKSGQHIVPVGGWYSEQSKKQAEKIRKYADVGVKVDEDFPHEH